MRPASVDDLRPDRVFDLRAFLISVAVGVAATVGMRFSAAPSQTAGPTAATLDDAAIHVLSFVVGAFVVGPIVALIVARGGRLLTAVAVIPATLAAALAIVWLR